MKSECTWQMCGTAILFVLMCSHHWLYFQARPMIVDIIHCECGDLWYNDIMEATYVVAWHNLYQTAPDMATFIWHYTENLLPSSRHPAIQRLSIMLSQNVTMNCAGYCK